MTSSTAAAALPPSSAFHAHGPRLLADIGGTNARFALEFAAGRFEAIEVLACDDYPTIAAALQAYLALPAVQAQLTLPLRHAALAIANPITGDTVRMTNHHWEFSIEALRQACGFATLVVANDFTALARALPHLADDQKVQVGGGAPVPNTPLGLVGAGTGLGVSGLIPCKSSWTALLSEGGHVTFSPANELEVAILTYAWREFDHVSAERFLSGDGIVLLYRAIASHEGVADEGLDAPEISRRALAGESPLCMRAIDTFCGMLGTVAGNLAITLGAQGGIYIGGGIVPRLGDYFARSPFRARFEHKGRFVHYLSQVPTYIITAKYPAFVGVSAILAEKLADQQGS
ncbi:glucokinase [Massilia sp. PAMC28688]|uniref:glucokinase n=1 Tax=Massilia sp. PAMC28688 TaxID=2861283 RepID=UPI001C62B5DC|nr:glucokinase [Massilia sp. PAMC28688]QYF94234.1 glucokinase [Massilia sp. PAMC28688]